MEGSEKKEADEARARRVEEAKDVLAAFLADEFEQRERMEREVNDIRATLERTIQAIHQKANAAEQMGAEHLAVQWRDVMRIARGAK